MTIVVDGAGADCGRRSVTVIAPGGAWTLPSVRTIDPGSGVLGRIENCCGAPWLANACHCRGSAVYTATGRPESANRATMPTWNWTVPVTVMRTGSADARPR